MNVRRIVSVCLRSAAFSRASRQSRSGHVVGHRHAADDLLQVEDLLGRSASASTFAVTSAVVRRTISNSSSSSGIVDVGVEHEAVQLGLGQRVGAFLLDRVLRGQHEERLVELDAALPPTVTWCSCIASSSAAWVFGGVRLISSARITLAKIGPLQEPKLARARAACPPGSPRCR